MPGLFLDSSGWFAAMTPRESGYALARRTYTNAAQRGTRMVTTAFVVAEVHTLVLRWRDIRTADRFLHLAFDSRAHTIIEVTQEMTAAAMARWIRRYEDKKFSLCDAISFEVMHRERIARALTFDRHFVVAGYEILE